MPSETAEEAESSRKSVPAADDSAMDKENDDGSVDNEVKKKSGFWDTERISIKVEAMDGTSSEVNEPVMLLVELDPEDTMMSMDPTCGSAATRRRKQDMTMRHELRDHEYEAPRYRNGAASRIRWPCAVDACKYPRDAKDRDGVNFHRVPKDKLLQEAWSRKCKKELHANARVCSKHFTDDDFVRDLYRELLGEKVRKLLTPTAVPSLLLDASRNKKPTAREEAKKKSEAARKERRELKERKELIDQLLKASNEHQPLEDPMDPSAPITTVDDAGNIVTTKSTKKLKNNLSYLQLPPKNKTVSTQTGVAVNDALLMQRIVNCNNRIRRLNKDVMSKGKQITRLTSEKHKYEVAHEIISRKFSSAQANFLLGRKVRPKAWTHQELQNAYMLRCLSPKTYTFIRHRGMMALPGKSTIRNWIKKGGLNSSSTRDASFATIVEAEAGQNVVALGLDEVEAHRVADVDSDTDSASSSRGLEDDEAPESVTDATTIVTTRDELDALASSYAPTSITDLERNLNLALIDSLSPAFALAPESSDANHDRSEMTTLDVTVIEAELPQGTRMLISNPGIDAGSFLGTPTKRVLKPKAAKKKGNKLLKKELTPAQREKLRERERNRKRGTTKVFKPQLMQFRSASTIATQTD